MINQMQQSNKSCLHCLQHEGDLPKVPLHPILPTAPLDLLRIDFTSTETTMELNKLPRGPLHEAHYGICDPNQTAKAVAKFLCQGYMLIFGALVRLLSDRGTNFMSSIIDKMCILLSMKKLRTMPYHPQTNGLVERSHQTLMQMIEKLGEGKKADWPGHLAEIVQAYNATWSAMMGYSPHYLMFYFPTFRSTEAPWEATPKCVDKYVATVHDRLRATLWEAQAQSTAEAQWQKPYYDWKIGTAELKSGDLVLVKANAFKEKRKIKDRWEMRHLRWFIRLWQMYLPTK